MWFILYLFNSSFFYLLINANFTSDTGLEKRNLIQFDFFGPTAYGFQCEDSVYLKHDIYAASNKACQVWFNNMEKKIHEAGIFQTERSVARDAAFKEFSNANKNIHKPYMLYPILLDKNIFEERQDMNPGPHRIVLDKKCDFIGILTSATSSSSNSPARTRSRPNSPGSNHISGIKMCSKLDRPQ